MNNKFYKILPKNLNCRGFQYKEGLNVDKNIIDPYACSFGLHFSDAAHIMEFCDYGSMIADVEVPDDAIVYHFNYKSKADKIILKNIRPLWDVNTLKALVDEGVDIHADDDYVFRYAVLNEYLEVVKLLIENGADVHARDDYAFRYAKQLGFTEIVDYLQSVK